MVAVLHRFRLRSLWSVSARPPTATPTRLCIGKYQPKLLLFEGWLRLFICVYFAVASDVLPHNNIIKYKFCIAPSCYHVTTSIYYTDHFKLGGEARPNENISQGQRSLFEGGRRAHKNERGILSLCSDWRELSERFSMGHCRGEPHQAFATW